MKRPLAWGPPSVRAWLFCALTAVALSVVAQTNEPMPIRLLGISAAITEDTNQAPYAVVTYITPASNTVTLCASTNLVDWWPVDCVTNFEAEDVTNSLLIADWSTTPANYFFKATMAAATNGPPQ